MKNTKVNGQLEIDHRRGVIYFHSDKGLTLLRICQLPTPIPTEELDITHMYGCNWKE